MALPPLSYAHLFSFQVAYSNMLAKPNKRSIFKSSIFRQSIFKRLSKKTEWRTAILEFDFGKETMILYDRDERVVASANLTKYKVVATGKYSNDGTLVSIRSEEDQYDMIAQNKEEKKTILHLLECIGSKITPEVAAESGKKKGLSGMNMTIMKHGRLILKGDSVYKKDERHVVVLPGKLLLFLDEDIAGKRVHYATSLIDAKVQAAGTGFQIDVRGTTELSFSFQNTLAEMAGWMNAIDASIRGETTVPETAASTQPDDPSLKTVNEDAELATEDEAGDVMDTSFPSTISRKPQLVRADTKAFGVVMGSTSLPHHGALSKDTPLEEDEE